MSISILLASDSNVERAGVCLFMLQWVENIRRLNKDIYICAYFRKRVLDKEIAQQYRDNGVEVVLGELPQDQTSMSLSNRAKVRLDIQTILKKKKYDVLHVNSSAVGFTSLVLTEGARFEVPVRISHSHGKNINSIFKRICLWPYKKYNKHLATKYASCSIDAGEYLFGKGIQKNPRWHFVPNTIDVRKFAYNFTNRKKRRCELGLRDETVLLGAVGMLTQIKNHQFMVEIVKTLKEQGEDVKLLIIGEGEERENLEKLISSYGLKDDVILYGVTHDVNEWLSAFDFYMMTSLTEGLPISAVEAQANGLICLLSDRIPNDVDITLSVYHLPIDQGVDSWVKMIKDTKRKTGEERAEGEKNIVDSGFDNASAVQTIEKLYDL